jgi:hypothetical protein
LLFISEVEFHFSWNLSGIGNDATPAASSNVGLGGAAVVTVYSPAVG